MFGVGAGVLGTVVAMEAHRRKMREARRRTQETQLLEQLRNQAAKPINFTPPPGEISPHLDERAAHRIAELEASGELAKVRREREEEAQKLVSAEPSVPSTDKIAITPGESVTRVLEKPVKVLVARHRAPSPSPLASINMSLTTSATGWQVAKLDPVTSTDLLNLKAIRDMDEAGT